MSLSTYYIPYTEQGTHPKNSYFIARKQRAKNFLGLQFSGVKYRCQIHKNVSKLRRPTFLLSSQVQPQQQGQPQRREHPHGLPRGARLQVDPQQVGQVGRPVEGPPLPEGGRQPSSVQQLTSATSRPWSWHSRGPSRVEAANLNRLER